jgi:hypothetical protein
MVSWSLQSPAFSPGAIATFQLAGTEPAIDAAVHSLHLGPLPLGAVALRDVLGVDRAVVARFASASIHIFTHGSPAIIRALAAALTSAGIPETAAHHESLAWPEAATAIEARMLAALARATSPLAIDLLLDQPRRWAGLPAPAGPPVDPLDPGQNVIPRDSPLRHLLSPPLIIAIGPPNIGKSSLLNALAGRGLALVADEPGTTRDHIGAHIDLAGLVVRYIDTPGMSADAETAPSPDADAIALAASLLRSADLILSCGDITAPPLPPAQLPPLPHDPPILTIATRADRGTPPWPHHLAISALTGHNLPLLVSTVRDHLVPPALLADPRPWRFPQPTG